MVQKKEQHGAFSRAGFAILLVLATVSVAGLLYLPRMLRAASVVYAFSHRYPPPLVAVYNRFFGYAVAFQDEQVQGRQGPIDVRVYTPLGRKTSHTIVCVHGFAPDGNKSPPLNSFAEALAHQGFRVVLPTVPEEEKIHIQLSDVDVIEDVITWSAKTGDGTPLSVAGISFGGGLSIVAASRPAVQKDVRLILSISGYNDLPTIGRYYIRVPVFAPDGTPYPKNPSRATAMIFLGKYLDEMVPPKDLPAIQNFIAGLVRAHTYPVNRGDAIANVLTPEQQDIFFALQDVATPAVQQAYEGVIQRHYAEMEAVSPKSVLGRLDTTLYALHGSTDYDIPPEEVMWMAVEVPPGADAHLLITPWMSHAAVGRKVTLWDRLKVIHLLAQMLSQAAH